VFVGGNMDGAGVDDLFPLGIAKAGPDLIPFITSWMADTRLAALPVALYAFDFFLVNVTYIVLIYESRFVCACLMLYLRPDIPERTRAEPVEETVRVDLL
jgi:hypothetical protein